jgi:hypothetical protein
VLPSPVSGFLTPPGPGTDWEKLWAPYDPATYRQVLDYIEPQDVIVEIGAGDLRLACQLARAARMVYAVELQPALLARGVQAAGSSLPINLHLFAGDALTWPFPNSITKGVLLMRHCSHFLSYANKLRAVGAQALITNARWGMNVEIIGLLEPRLDYRELSIGWFACWCGAAGFKPGPASRLIPPLDTLIHEVIGCPDCEKDSSRSATM